MFLVFLFPSLALADRFTDHIAKYVTNNAQNPCEDYFKYICPSNVDFNQSYWSIKSKEFELEYSILISATYLRLTKAIEDKSINNIEGFERLVERCEHSPEFYSNFKAILAEVFGLEKVEKLHECSEIAGSYIYQFENEAHYLQQAQGTLKRWADTYAFYEYAQINEYVPQVIEMSSFIFERIRDFVYDELELSNWLKPIKEHSLKVIRELKYRTPKYKDGILALNKFFASSHDAFLRCRRLLNGFTSIDPHFCTRYALRNITALNVVDYPWNPYSLNAYYSRKSNSIIVDALAFLPTNFSLQTTAVLIAYTIGHEIGHAIFSNTKTIQSTYKDCLVNNMYDTCEIYTESKFCGSGRATYHEDASDWVSLQTVLHLAKHDLLRKYTDLPDLRTLIDIYGYSWCDLNDDVPRLRAHSPKMLRVNAMVRQLQEFQDEFGCNSKDPMVADKKCYLTGANSKKRSRQSIVFV